MATGMMSQPLRMSKVRNIDDILQSKYEIKGSHNGHGDHQGQAPLENHQIRAKAHHSKECAKVKTSNETTLNETTLNARHSMEHMPATTK
eukprot:3317492-Amphidinium_carterae.1